MSHASERFFFSCQIKYTLFADASRYGTPPIKALFYEFPNEPELFTVDEQFMVGDALLVTPVLHPNVTAVQGVKASGSSFPSCSVKR